MNRTDISAINTLYDAHHVTASGKDADSGKGQTGSDMTHVSDIRLGYDSGRVESPPARNINDAGLPGKERSDNNSKE